MKNFITPAWPAPATVKAFSTGKINRLPLLPQSDDTEKKQANRTRFKEFLHLPNDPIWIHQVHGKEVVLATPRHRNAKADAAFAVQPEQVCVVLTADCLPILICNQAGTHVAAIHAGWRGLAVGVVEATIKSLGLLPETLMAWIGPAISAKHYEVGAEVKKAFLNKNKNYENYFTPNRDQHWLLDLNGIATHLLQEQGVRHIYHSHLCTFSDSDSFHSFRREKQLSGHNATAIYISA